MSDAPADGLPGSECPTSAVELLRIADANIFSDTLGPGFSSSGLYARDLDGDGDSDLLAFEEVAFSPTPATYRTRMFRFDAATGTFGPEIRTTLQLPRYGVPFERLGDVDGDGRLDLVLGYTTPLPRTPYVAVARQAADGTFALQPFLIDVSPCGDGNDQRLKAFSVLDVNHDGMADVLATVSIGGLSADPSGLSLAKGTPSGLANATCVASATVATPGFPAELARAISFHTGDFDGDGARDLIWADYTNMQLFVSRGSPDFRALPAVAPRPLHLTVDRIAGRAQAALLGVSVGGTTTELSRYPIDAQSGIAAAVPLATLPTGHAPNPATVLHGFATGDFNGDHLTDVIEIGYRTGVRGPTPFSITCDRATTWQLGQGELPTATRILRSIDIDNDGRSEVVARVGLDVVVFRLQ